MGRAPQTSGPYALSHPFSPTSDAPAAHRPFAKPPDNSRPCHGEQQQHGNMSKMLTLTDKTR